MLDKNNLDNYKCLSCFYRIGVKCIAIVHVIIALIIIYGIYKNFQVTYNTYATRTYFFIFADFLLVLINLGSSIFLWNYKRFGVVLSGAYFSYKAIRSIFAYISSLINIFAIRKFDLYTLAYNDFIKDVFIFVLSTIAVVFIFKLSNKLAYFSAIKRIAIFVGLGIGLNLVYIALSFVLN